MRLALSRDGKRISDTVIVSTPKRFNDGMTLFHRIGKKLSNGKKIKAIAGGAAGPLDENKTILVNPPNLKRWKGKPLVSSLRKIFHAPVYLDNDAAMAGMGESVFGRGKGRRIVAYLTISTGVGGVRIVDGNIDQSAMGFEPGHQIIVQTGKKATTLEDRISGTAFERRYKKKPYEIHDARIWDEVAKNLAYGLCNTIVHWSPDIVILGGSMMKKVGIPIPRVRHHLQKILHIFPNIPPIQKAKLGDKAGLYGALAYVRQMETKK